MFGDVDSYKPPKWLDSESQDILVDCLADTKKFCQVFLPDEFTAEFCCIHDEIFYIVDKTSYQKVVIASTRGIGKTTIMRALCAKAILYRQVRFIAYCSKSETMAMMQTENMKDALRSDAMVKRLFGDIKTVGIEAANDASFSKKSWVANNHTFVLPRGAGQQIRGLNWRSFRPDYFFFDDLEDDEEIENEELRKSLKRWFFGPVIKAIPRTHKNWRVFYIDTIKHEDALIEHLLKRSDWYGIRLPVCGDDYKTNAPDFYSQEELDEELEQHREHKQMDIFAREIMCLPISKEDATFKAEFFQYYKETDEEFVSRDRRGLVESVVIIDPAKTKKMNSAQSGIVVWGIDIEKNALFLREARGEFYSPDELYNDAFETAKRYGARVIGVEVTSLNEFITQPMTNEMLRRGDIFELVWLQARAGKGELSGLHGGKAARVGSLLTYYRQGLIMHNEENCGAYEMQLLSFPRPSRWDIIDAAAYIIEMMEKGDRFMLGDEAAQGVYDTVEEFDDLKYEPALDMGYAL